VLEILWNAVFAVWYNLHTSTPIFSTETKTTEKRRINIGTSMPIKIRHANTIDEFEKIIWKYLCSRWETYIGQSPFRHKVVYSVDDGRSIREKSIQHASKSTRFQNSISWSNAWLLSCKWSVHQVFWYVNSTQKWTGMKTTGFKIPEKDQLKFMSHSVCHTIRELNLSVRVLVFSSE